MQYRELGGSGVKVSEISLGCWTLGGPNWSDGQSNGWADIDEADAIRGIHRALDLGVNHFDNADAYGNGRAERLLARALGPRSGEVVIATKLGHFRGTAEHAYEPAHIRHQCEQSLVNLRREVIDLYYFHHGDFGPGDRYLDDAVAMMHRLRDEGKIRLIGLSAYSHEDFTRLVPRIEPTVLQSWAHAIDDRFIREGSPTRRLMDERGLTFVAFSPLNQGVLLDKYKADAPPVFGEGDYRRGQERFSAAFLKRVEPKLARLKTHFGGQTSDLVRMALQYLLANSVVACVIPGFRSLAQVEMNLSPAGSPLTPADVQFIQQVFAEEQATLAQG